MSDLACVLIGVGLVAVVIAAHDLYLRCLYRRKETDA